MMIELWVGKKIPREKSGILGLFIDEKCVATLKKEFLK
jgi:hypothetical protein